MAAQKRRIEEPSSSQQSKKARQSKNESGQSGLTTDEVDFPRGGGTSFTPLEVKNIRAEAVKEADEGLFEVRTPYIVTLSLH